jgi:HEAT repeat protein
MQARVALLVCLWMGVHGVAQESPPAVATKTAVSGGPKLSARDRAWLMLIRGASDEKAEKRIEALSALGTVRRNREAEKFLENALRDEDRDVRQMSATTLGEMRSRNSIPKLKQALEDEAPEVVFAAARSLWMMGEKNGRGVLVEVLAGERAAGRGVVSEKMSQMRKMLSSPKGLVLFGVREAVGSVAGPYMMGMHVVNEFVKDRAVAARVVCANMLATDQSSDAYVTLVEALRDNNWVVRLAAAKALGIRGDRKAIPNLQGNIDDEDEKSAVKLMAAAAIVNLSR